MTVTSGSAALRSACRSVTAIGESPFACAVREEVIAQLGQDHARTSRV
jgi:hypothetical protein